jgi:uncharacterized protein with PIN domain
MKFAADRMLGKLAKWLRILGYDTLYSRTLSDGEFLALAEKNRILLSRNRALINKGTGDKVIFVAEDDPRVQLRDLVHELGLKPDPDRFFSRCTVCNESLKSVKADDVKGRVPDHTWAGHTTFSECETCGRVYWPGSHLERSRREIEQLLKS